MPKGPIRRLSFKPSILLVTGEKHFLAELHATCYMLRATCFVFHVHEKAVVLRYTFPSGSVQKPVSIFREHPIGRYLLVDILVCTERAFIIIC